MSNLAAIGAPHYDSMEQILLRAFLDISGTIQNTVESIASEYERHCVVHRFYELADHILNMRAEMLALTRRLDDHSGDGE